MLFIFYSARFLRLLGLVVQVMKYQFTEDLFKDQIVYDRYKKTVHERANGFLRMLSSQGTTPDTLLSEKIHYIEYYVVMCYVMHSLSNCL